MSFIPYGRQSISKSDLAEVSKALKNDKITTGNRDWLMSNTIKKEAIKPEKVPESVLSPIFIIGYNLPTIAAKESPIDKNNKAATAIGILNNITVTVHPINNQVAPVCSPFDSLSRSIK